MTELQAHDTMAIALNCELTDDLWCVLSQYRSGRSLTLIPKTSGGTAGIGLPALAV